MFLLVLFFLFFWNVPSELKLITFYSKPLAEWRAGIEPGTVETSVQRTIHKTRLQTMIQMADDEERAFNHKD